MLNYRMGLDTWVRVGFFREFFLFWFFALTLSSVIFLRLYGFGLSNVPAFLVYLGTIFLIAHRGVLRVSRPNHVFFVTLLFFGGAFLSIFLQNEYNGSVVDRNGVDSYGNAVSNLGISLVYFFLGYFSFLPEGAFLKRQGTLLLLVVFAVMAFKGLGVLDYEAIKASTGIDVDQVQVSQSVLVLVLFCFAYAQREQRIIIAIFGSVILFFSGSRTAFIVGLMVMLVLAGAFQRFWRALVFLVLAAVFVGIYVALFAESPSEAVSRMLFSGGIAGDSSAASRLLQFEMGVAALKDQILIGDMNFVVRQFDGVGFYMHNILSYWQQYGFLIFLLVLSVLVWGGGIAYADFVLLREVDDGRLMFRLALYAYCLVSVLISLSYTYKFFWLMVGMYSKRILVDFGGGTVGKS